MTGSTFFRLPIFLFIAAAACAQTQTTASPAVSLTLPDSVIAGFDVMSVSISATKTGSAGDAKAGSHTENIALIEQPEYKRRWSDTAWDDKVADALHVWLLDRLESYFDLDGRMQDRSTGVPPVSFTGGTPVLRTTAKLADLASRDPAFQTVAELYRGRPDFDMVKLVTELVEAESVPLLPVLRYKPSGLDKRRA